MLSQSTTLIEKDLLVQGFDPELHP